MKAFSKYQGCQGYIVVFPALLFSEINKTVAW